MEQEYHQLKSTGKVNEAEEVKGLIDWKTKQKAGFNNSASIEKKNENEININLCIQTFKDAAYMNPSLSDCYEEYLGILVEAQKFDDALTESEKFLSIHPSQRILNLVFAIASIRNEKFSINTEIFNECLNILEQEWMISMSEGVSLGLGIGLGMKKHIFIPIIFDSIELAYCKTAKPEKILNLCQDALFVIPNLIQNYQKQSKSFRNVISFFLSVQTKALIVSRIYHLENFGAFTAGLHFTVLRNSIMLRDYLIMDSTPNEPLEEMIFCAFSILYHLQPSSFVAFQIAKT